MKHLYSLMPLHVIFSFCLLVGFINVSAQVQTARYASMTPNSNAFYEYLPQGYETETQTYPLMVFLHGGGELGIGSSITLPTILKNGVPRYISEGIFPVSFTVNGSVYKFIVLSPQFINWPSNDDVQNIIDYAVKNYRVNTNRIYLVGMSMGGGAAWDYAGSNAANAKRIAAIVPVCGASEPAVSKVKIMAATNLPIWATHNQGDPTVPVSYTNYYVDSFNTSKPVPNPFARRTIFPVVGHDAWSATFIPSFKENNMNVYEWMLQYQRGATPNVAPKANAGPDQIITLPLNSSTLAGSGSDEDGTIVKYSWAQVSGPAQYSISNSNIANPVIANMVTGDYTFRLTVTDNSGATASDDVIIKVNNAILNVLNGLPIPGKIEAENYIAMSGVETETTSDKDGGLNVGHIDSGDWLDYRLNVGADGLYTLNARIATPYPSQQFQVRKEDGTVLATVNIPQTTDFQSWATVRTTLALPSGPQTIRIYSVRGGWNLNWLEFIASVSQSVPGRIEAESYDVMSGVETESTLDEGGGSDIGYFDTNDWLDYNVNVAAAGTYTFNARVSTPYASQQFQVRKADGTVLATLNVPQTGFFQTWSNAKVNITLPAGKQTIRIYSSRGTWNFNWMEFVTGASSDAEILSGSPVFSEISSQKIIETKQQEPSSSLYPNPVNERFVLDITNVSTGTFNVQILDQSGNLVKTVKFSKNQPVIKVNVPVNELPAGVYYMKIQMPGWTDSKRFIKL